MIPILPKLKKGEVDLEKRPKTKDFPRHPLNWHSSPLPRTASRLSSSWVSCWAWRWLQAVLPHGHHLHRRFSNVRQHQNPLESWLKHRSLSATHRVSALIGLWWGPRICVSHEFPGMQLVPRLHLEKHWPAPQVPGPVSHLSSLLAPPQLAAPQQGHASKIRPRVKCLGEAAWHPLGTHVFALNAANSPACGEGSSHPTWLDAQFSITPLSFLPVSLWASYFTSTSFRIFICGWAWESQHDSEITDGPQNHLQRTCLTMSSSKSQWSSLASSVVSVQPRLKPSCNPTYPIGFSSNYMPLLLLWCQILLFQVVLLR